MFGSQYVATDATNLNTHYDTEELDRDIGNVAVAVPPEVPFNLFSSEQKILKEILHVIGKNPTTEFHLQGAPRWLIDKSMATEKESYKREEAYRGVKLQDLPCGSNIISSHHFFQIKHDEEEEKLKLKCRLVPLGNRDQDKDEVRKYSATAQFRTIRLVLSIEVILHFRTATLDIKSAYIQSGEFRRDVFVRPPKGWRPAWNILWNLLKPAYGFVESGHGLSQLSCVRPGTSYMSCSVIHFSTTRFQSRPDSTIPS